MTAPVFGLQGQNTEPNILLIIGDDIGVHEIGAYDSSELAPKTPSIDQLAEAGVLFDAAWAHPICSPTRAALHTGRYTFRHGIGGIVREDTIALPLSEITLPEVLREGTNGLYTTALFGKWHLGNESVGGDLSPNAAGYDHFEGVMANFDAAFQYFNYEEIQNGVRKQVSNYATTETVDDALAWIATAPEPWFCVVSFNAPHKPWHEPPAHLHSVDLESDNSDRQKYRAAVEAMDTEIGRLLQSAEIDDLEEPIDIVFMGDNGTPSPVLAEGTPFWQAKWWLFDGGIRVPFIYYSSHYGWMQRKSSFKIHAVDLFATFARRAGVSLNSVLPSGYEIDSLDLRPYLQNPFASDRRQFHFSEIFKTNGFPPYQYRAVAASDGRYKLVASYRFDRHEPIGFYDSWSDPEEAVNIFTTRQMSQSEQDAFDELKVYLRDLVR